MASGGADGDLADDQADMEQFAARHGAGPRAVEVVALKVSDVDSKRMSGWNSP